MELQANIKKGVDDTIERDQHIGKLSVMMEGRVLMTEANVNKLEQEISVTKGKLQVSEAGLIAIRRQIVKEKLASNTDLPSDQNAEASLHEEPSLQSSNQTGSESRDDGCMSTVQPTKRPRAASPAAQGARQESNLASLALAAIAQSKKKNTLRKFDIRLAQSRIFGTDKKLPARTSPFSKRVTTKPVEDTTETEMETEVRAQTLDSSKSDASFDGRE